MVTKVAIKTLHKQSSRDYIQENEQTITQLEEIIFFFKLETLHNK